MQIPILCYHRVLLDGETPPPTASGYSGHVKVSQFRAHMKMLAHHQMQTITHDDLIDGLKGRKAFPTRPVMIDFDDNRMAAFQNARATMAESGFVGTVFVVSDLADGITHPHLGSLEDFPAMGWGELRTLMDSGWCVGGHTKSHRWLKELCESAGPAAVESELAEGTARTQEMLHANIRAFAYPAGSWSDEVETVVKRHFESARHWSLTLPADYVTPETDIHRLPCANVDDCTDTKALEQWIRSASG